MTKKKIDVRVFSTMLFVLALSPALSAQQQPEPKPLRFDLTPFSLRARRAFLFFIQIFCVPGPNLPITRAAAGLVPIPPCGGLATSRPHEADGRLAHCIAQTDSGYQLPGVRRLTEAGGEVPKHQVRSGYTQGESSTHGLRFHDLRHHAITELAESQASDQTIMSIAGHVSREMLERYSHIRMDAKRKALARKSHEE